MRPPLALHLTFPRELSPQTRRFRQFMARARTLEIVMTVPPGRVITRSIAPAQWSAIGPVPSPPGAGDGFLLQARIWDNRADGAPRSFPVLTTAPRRITGAELHRDEPVPVHLRFSLHVSEREWEE